MVGLKQNLRVALQLWVVATLGLEVQAATPRAKLTSFITAPEPAGYPWITGHGIRDCAMDSKGNVYYAKFRDGFFYQPSDVTKSPVRLSGLDDLLGWRMGIEVDSVSDSIWLGGVDGQVRAGKLVNGSVSTWKTLPTIPLLYTKWDVTGFLQEKWTHVNDIVKDSKGRLVAATDSLAWRLENGAWKPMGVDADYHGILGKPFDRATAHPNGQVFIADYPVDINILNDDGSITWPGDIRSGGLYVGPHTGFLYTGGGVDGNAFNISASPFTSPTVVETDLDNDGALAFFEDKSGWLWVGTEQGVHVLNPSHEGKLYFPLEAYINNGVLVSPYLHKILLSPDSSSFWACGAWNVYKYSTKYGIPAEATSAIQTKVLSQHAVQVKALQGALQFRVSDQSEWLTRVVDARGNLAWEGLVKDQAQVELRSGMWFVNCRKGKEQKTFRVVVLP